MKKLYLFGDSFSLFTTDIKEYYSNDVEFNTHHSLSNDHILKLVKLKLNKLLKGDIDASGSTILIQLTVCSRICVLQSNINGTREFMESVYGYDKDTIKFGDTDIFKNKYRTLYPNMASMNSDLVKMIYMPYLGFFINKNEPKIFNDLILEISLLKKLAESMGINLEYFLYSSDFDKVLNNVKYEGEEPTESSHIKFDDHNSLQSYIAENRPEYFVSKMDIHFNNNGNKWYINWLKERYDIGNR
jgi:hypothetical protein